MKRLIFCYTLLALLSGALLLPSCKKKSKDKVDPVITLTSPHVTGQEEAFVVKSGEALKITGTATDDQELESWGFCFGEEYRADYHDLSGKSHSFDVSYMPTSALQGKTATLRVSCRDKAGNASAPVTVKVRFQ